MALEHRILPSGPAAPRAARAEMRRCLGGRLDPGALVDAELLVSELATNSVRHARSTGAQRLRLELDLGADRLWVRWCDEGGGFEEHRPRPRDDGRGGWGLVLVDHVAADWGTTWDEGFCVWFELALGARGEAVPATDRDRARTRDAIVPH